MTSLGENGRGELPHGWAWATLGDLGLYHNGRGFKKSEWRETGRPIIRIQNLTDPAKPFNYFDGQVDPRNEVRAGDILVSWAATLDAFIWRGPDAVLNQHIFHAESQISPRFHYYLLKYVLSDLRAQAHGSGMVHITRDRFLNTPVRLPPRPEQDRIVAAIETRMNEVADGFRSAESAASAVSALRPAVLERSIAKGDEVPVGDVLLAIEAGKSFRCQARPAGPDEWGVIKVSAMTWGAFRGEENKAVLPRTQVDARWEIKPGDVLLSRANTSAYVGASVLVHECRSRLLLSDKSLRLRPAEGILPEWLLAALSAPRTRAQISEMATGTKDSMRNISQAKLRRVRIRVPSESAQRAIVAELYRQLQLVEKAARDLAWAREHAVKLQQATLAIAMAGALVAQDPTDEPASELLRTIREEAASTDLQIERVAR